jgi:hypothetical protein
LVALLSPTAALALPPDWTLANGHVYTQAGAAGRGFVVTDRDAPFLSAFGALGGVADLGYPVSGRFAYRGFTTQAFQKGVLQWRPEANAVVFLNVMDELTAAGRDDFLARAYAVPMPTLGTDETGRSFPEIAAARLRELDVRPAMRAFYDAAPDPIDRYGLPTSKVVDMGTHYAVRLQRAVLQEWKSPQPWARAGQVVAANVGDMARDAGLWPAAAAAIDPCSDEPAVWDLDRYPDTSESGEPFAGAAVEVTIEKPTVMYRVWGGGSGRIGRWLSPYRAPSAAVARAALALPASNLTLCVSEVHVPAGARAVAGVVAPLNQQPGGGTQFMLTTRIPETSFDPGVSIEPTGGAYP